MIKKIRRRIVSETKQVAVLIDSTTQSDLRCDFCGESSVMISPLLAAKLSRISTREIYRLIETGKIHFVEMPAPDRQIFVCSKSLPTIDE